jgi:S1-C subfamily serine protease
MKFVTNVLVASLAVVSTFGGACASEPIEPPPEVLAAEAARIAVMQKASAATIAIFANEGQGGGSGVIISPDGYVLSNFHVTSEAGVAMKCGLPDGKLYDAVIVSVDPTGDVALLKLLGRDDFPAAELADSDRVLAGDWCFAAGNPFLLANDYQPSVSYGVVSGTHRYQYPSGTLLEYADCIQTDAAINPGNSGGPLFDASGQLIGINGRGSFEKRGRVNVGVGYAISINQIKHFLGYLKSGRIVDHATLGATVSTDEEGRVVVDDLLESSDAYRRGLRYDDEIVAFGGREIRTVNAFKNVLGIYPNGWQVPLTFRRDGKRYEILVRLAPAHRTGELEAVVRAGAEASPEIQPKKEPAPGDESEPKKPDSKKPQSAKHHKAKRAELPADVARVYEDRPGYVNYYFNQQNRARVWRKFQSQGAPLAADETWRMFGVDRRGAEAQISLSPELGILTLPAGESKGSFAAELRLSLNPPGSGGLLVALHLWQRLLTVGPARFGEVYYLGTVPLAGQKQLVDVLVGIYGGIETRFCFAPDTGQLLALQMYPDDGVDPCEISLGDYREFEGHLLPHRLEVRHGDATILQMEVKRYVIEK